MSIIPVVIRFFIKRNVCLVRYGLLLLTAFINQICFAQPGLINKAQEKYRAVQWGVEEGLSHGAANALLKDVNGFLWIGSQGELSRFDGSAFKNYYYDPNKPGTINARNTGGGIIEDSLHNIWIGTNKGLSRYDIKADTFTNFLHAKPFAHVFGASRQKVFCVEEDSIITTYDIHSFEKKTLAILTSADSAGNAVLYSFFDERTNSIWMLRGHSGSYGGPPGGGLLQISLPTGEKKYYDWNCYKNIPGHHHGGEGMCYDRERNCLWINSWEGLMQFTLGDKQFHYIGGLNSFFTAKDYGHWVGICMDTENRVWLATKPKGIVIYDHADHSVTFPFAENTISQKEISDYNASIYCDSDGMVWTGFWMRKGIYQVLPYSQVVKRYTANPDQLYSLNNNTVNSILSTANNKIWIGTEGGALNIFDAQTGFFQVLHEKDMPGMKIKNLLVTVSVDTNIKKAWIGTDEGFFETDILTKKSRPVIYRNQDNQIIPELNGAIASCHHKEIVVTGSYNNQQGIFILNKDSNIARQVLTFPDNRFDPFFTNAAGPGLIFLKGQQDSVGIKTYANNNGKWTLTPTPIDSIELSCIIYDEKDSTWWVAGERQLFHFGKDFSIIRRYTSENGLPEFTIGSMVPDNKRNIWFCTDRSIHQMNIETGAIVTLSEKDGFEKQYFSLGTRAAKDASGKIYFPGGNSGVGFNQINPDKFISHPSSLYFKSIQINQKQIPFTTGVNNLHELSLQYFQNNITIETGIVDYYSKGSSHVRYKLEGLNDKWQYGPANYTIRYDGLPPGKHKLVMQASNAANEYTGPVKTLLILISPPYWQSWWFIVLIVVIIGIAINALFQFRLKQKMNVLAVRQKLHRDLHDDVGATLSSIKIYSEILQNNADNTLITDLIKTNATDMIDKLEIIAWATNPHHDSFKSFKEIINKYASPICYAKNIELNFEYDGVNENMIMPGHIRQNLFLIFKEAINNVIKYSNASLCSVQIGVRYRKFSFKITDNGKGFTRITKGNGSGLKNMQNRCAEINGIVTIESQDGKGTIISIYLPYPFKIPNFWDNNRSAV